MVEAFSKAVRYRGRDGKEFVSLVVHLGKVREVIEGRREVTSVTQLSD